jgi:hypothetical protein
VFKFCALMFVIPIANIRDKIIFFISDNFNELQIYFNSIY